MGKTRPVGTISHEVMRADLRQVSPPVQAKLDDAITEARARITPEHARGFFKHCGFPLPAQ